MLIGTSMIIVTLRIVSLILLGKTPINLLYTTYGSWIIEIVLPYKSVAKHVTLDVL